MLQLLVDTSVWLDLARSRDAQALIVPIRTLAQWGQLTLLVPQLVINEFDRNRPQAEARVAQSVSERFRQLRQDLHEYADPDRLTEWLDEMARHVPLVSSMTLRNFREISELLSHGQRLDPSAADYERVVHRALDKRAPAHLRKNSVADAMLIELYRSHLEHSEPDQRLCFVTANHEDFSAHNGDHRAPHQDLQELFDATRSRYVYGVDGLRDILLEDFDNEFADLVAEVRWIHDEPRTLTEILDAEQEFFSKVWYVRHLIRLEREGSGLQPPKDDIPNRATQAARAIEERYGKDNVGPWDDWHWGFVNGKLSALRWVLGEEWDFLDT